MRNRYYQLLRLGLALCVGMVTGCATGPDPFTGGELLVMVYSTQHAPVSGAELRRGGTLRGRSDSFGRIVAPDLPAGELRLLLSAPGYAPREVAFTFAASTQILYVALEPLGLFCGGAIEEKDAERIEEAIRLQKASGAPQDELLLLQALYMHVTAEEGWEQELEKLRHRGGAVRTNALIRALRARR